MYVRQLSVTDFRSWSAAELDLPLGPSVLVGPNGQGKTNLLEAIGYLSTLGSHRVASDGPLVRGGADQAIVRAAVVHQGRELTLEVQITPGEPNRARVNRSPLPRARELLGILRTVLFAPEDIALVRGDPMQRRRLLDELVTSRTPRLAGTRADYDRVLRQRSALLKTAGSARRNRGGSAGGELATLEVWDGHLARHGAELLAARLDLVEALAPHVTAVYATLAPGAATPVIGYRSSLGEELARRPETATGAGNDPELLEALLFAELGRMREQELDRGVCLVGPHRDDLELVLAGNPARSHASQGEAWSLALALRLASYELLRGEGAEPVLLLDDVFAELDVRRRARLVEVAAAAEQVLVTAAVPADVPDELDGARFDIGEGSVHRAQ